VLEDTDWRTSPNTGFEQQQPEVDPTLEMEESREDNSETEEDVLGPAISVDDTEENIMASPKYSSSIQDDLSVAKQVSRFVRVHSRYEQYSTNRGDNKLWDQPPAGEPYKVSEVTPVFGCSMGLRSDYSGCRYCLCKPCKVERDGQNAGTRTKRQPKTLKIKLSNKDIRCPALPERHLTINLVKECVGSYFKQGGGVGKSCPTMCCGCFRPFTA
jgi:hypothetical protein